MKVWTLMLCLGLTMQACSAAETCNVTAHYIPLEVELYEPATREYLEKHGVRLSGDLPKACALMRAARASAKNKSLAGEDKRLRVVITDEANEPLFITAEKEVVFRQQVAQIDVSLVEAAVSELAAKAGRSK